MSRLSFVEGTDSMEVTDISIGRFVFTPAAGEKISLEALREAIEGAGYEVEEARLTVLGTLTEDRRLIDEESGQSFGLVGEETERMLAEVAPETTVRVSGAWTVVEGNESLEPREWEVPAAGSESAPRAVSTADS